jgi:hypothetical protein
MLRSSFWALERVGRILLSCYALRHGSFHIAAIAGRERLHFLCVL